MGTGRENRKLQKARRGAYDGKGGGEFGLRRDVRLRGRSSQSLMMVSLLPVFLPAKFTRDTEMSRIGKESSDVFFWDFWGYTFECKDGWAGDLIANYFLFLCLP